MTVLRGLAGRGGRVGQVAGISRPSYPTDQAYQASLTQLDDHRLPDDALQRPALPAALRPRLDDLDDVAGLRLVLFVVAHELRRAPLGLAVQPVPHLPLDGDDDALLHLVADDDAGLF